MTGISTPTEIAEFPNGKRSLVILSQGQATGRPILPYDPDFLLRAYAVTVEGFPPSTFYASTRGRALADAWNAYVGAGYDASFGDFMKIAKALTTRPHARFGDPILVGGRKAFFVSWDSHYVQFVLPGQNRYSNAHRLDVTSVTGEPITRSWMTT